MASNIKISVTADTADLQARLAVAKAEAAGFGKELNSLAKEAIASGSALDNALKSKLIYAGEEVVRAKARVGELSAELHTVSGHAFDFGGALTQASAVANSFGIALPIASVAGIATALGEAAKSAFDYAEAVIHGAEKTGL